MNVNLGRIGRNEIDDNARLVAKDDSLIKILREAEKKGFNIGPITQIDNDMSRAGIVLYRGDVYRARWDGIITYGLEGLALNYQLYVKKK